MFRKYYLLIPLFLLLLSLNLVVFSDSYYLSWESSKDYYGEEVQNILDYFQGNDLNEERYSEREIVHLHDVRLLIWVSLLLLLVLLAVFLYFESPFSKIKLKYFFFYGGLNSFILLFISSVIFLNFEFFFRIFHEILFWNEFWLLPYDSTLIKMFPESFFIGALVRILLYMVIFSSLFILISLILRRKNGK